MLGQRIDAAADAGEDYAELWALMEALDTTYCEEEHRRTLRKLAPGGTVQRDAFVEWYVDIIHPVHCLTCVNLLAYITMLTTHKYLKFKITM